ncbi:Phosphoribosylaminoimidazole carboxylase [Dendrothele bispora CBS 962.96]|uniref:Phosphoribosylaminoimidazole carboxylase n=1 Tax=Dendrothele bispora (strain CBS 962.96) TaxID=1314807 RepID=A0A4S8MNH8_DENBC|nr:Phosphoribosylaminoimidazole carboxylase [Dendrothele bispora CBS 962.96]
MSDQIVGVLGRGQLGRMLASAASLLDIQIVFLNVSEDAPAKQAFASSKHIDGSFKDLQKISELASKVDVLTVEIEHVDVDALDAVKRSHPGVKIYPAPETIRIIQDKFLQKEHLNKHSCPLGEFMSVDPTPGSIKFVTEKLGLPLMLKSRTQAYDGRGNFLLRSLSDTGKAIEALGSGSRPLYAEKYLPFTKELTVMVVRSTSGEVASYPVVETVHKDNICHLVFAPLRTTDTALCKHAETIARNAVKTFEGASIFGVEMFLLEDGTITINEIAPRPHNSGHYTIEACETSQYSNHLRSILSLPIGSTSLKVPASVMLNLIGVSDSMEPIKVVCSKALEVAGASIHLYGKKDCRNGWKMGHITLVAPSDTELRDRLRPLLQVLPSPESSAVNQEKDRQNEIALYTPQRPSPTHSHPQPLISIIMGSDSDLPTMLPASQILARFSIPYKLTIVSAHRTPACLYSFAESASARGVKVIIAGAGGAAHLPGMVAAITGLPVIGVPVRSSTALDGVDSLYSIVQMPRGIPVATVAINNSTNAALLAVRILSTSDPRLLIKMEEYMKEMEGEVIGKVDRIEQSGWGNYEVKKH